MSEEGKKTEDLLRKMPASLRGRDGEKESLLSSILGDRRVMEEYRRLGFRDEDAGDFLVALSCYQESLDVCEKCPGLKDCPASATHCRYSLRVEEDGSLGVSLGLCELRRTREIMQNSFLYRDFPQEWMDYPAEERLPKAKRFGKIYDDEVFENKAKKPTFYIQGPQGTGKTFLSASLAMFQAEKGLRVAFLDCARRLEEIARLATDYRNPGAFAEAIEELVSSDLLVLDDFGAGYMTARIRDQLLLPLLEGRLRAHRPTILTSRDDYHEIAKEFGRIQYGARQGERLSQCLEEGIGERSYIRLSVPPVLSRIERH